MTKLSRRTLLEGLGSAFVTAFAPAPVLAALPTPMRSLEDFIGPERLARAHYLWTLPGWLWRGGEIMLDAEGRFAMSPVFRAALTAIMNGCDAVAFSHDALDGYDQRRQNRIGIAVLSQFGLLPPKLGIDHFWKEQEEACRKAPKGEEDLRDAFSVGDSWQKMGWPAPRLYMEQEYPPDPEWMMTGVARDDTPFLLKHMTHDFGWGDPHFGNLHKS